jgi:hypothetical protein
MKIYVYDLAFAGTLASVLLVGWRSSSLSHLQLLQLWCPLTAARQLGFPQQRLYALLVFLLRGSGFIVRFWIDGYRFWAFRDTFVTPSRGLRRNLTSDPALHLRSKATNIGSDDN